MNEMIDHFHFLRPVWLLLIPCLFLLELLLRREAGTDDPFRGIIEPALLEKLRLRQTSRVWFNPGSALRVLMLLTIIIAAGPSWRQQPSPLAEDAAPLVLVIDVSESMASTDIAPSRLERAGQKMRDLLGLVPDKKVGLLIYAGSAHTMLPLTTDHDIAENYLAALSTSLSPRSGKFAEYALPGIDKLLGATLRQASVLLVTDGLGAASRDLISAWCTRSPHQLLVYGVGSDSPAQSDAPLERDALKGLARDCSGSYTDVSVDTRDVEAIANGLSDTYLTIDDEALPWLDGGYPLLWPAMLLALLWFRRGWTRTWAWLLLPVCLSFGDPAVAQSDPDRAFMGSEPEVQEGANQRASAKSASPTNPAGPAERLLDGFVGLWLSPDQYGRVLLSLGHYDKAAHTFDNPVWQATAHYYAENFQKAETLFTRKDSDQALFNEANARAQRRDYVRAIARYNLLLERAPDFPGAQENRDLIQGIVDDINRMSASQQQESGVGSDELDESDPQIGDGADELEMQPQKREQFSAEDILASPETAAMWLKGVQQDPTRFLATKFSIQLQERGVSER